MQRYMVLSGAEHKNLGSDKKFYITIDLNPFSPLWGYTLRICCPSSTFQSVPSMAQRDMNCSSFCCKVKCSNSNVIHAQTKKWKSLRVSVFKPLQASFRVAILACPGENWPGRSWSP